MDFLVLQHMLIFMFIEQFYSRAEVNLIHNPERK